METSRLLLELYRAAREEPEGAFEEHVLRLLKLVLSFESAIWGSGRLHADGHLTPHVVHLHRQPVESLQVWARINVADPVAAKCMSNPGTAFRFHAPTLFARPASAAMRDYAKRYKRQSYMVCGMQLEAQSDLMAWLSIYRSDPEAHFSEDERERYSQIMAHLHEALQINRRFRLCQTFDARAPEVLAIADPWGYLLTPPQEVEELLSNEWPKSASGRLPPMLVDALNAEHEATFRGHAISVRSRRVGGLLFLRMRRCSLLDGLSTREREVADVIARGLSAKESGKTLGLAPATVRVHLKRIYDKLAVHSQAELAYLIGRSSSELDSATAPRMVREAG